MTEKELLHKQQRKAKRRRERKRELAKNPLKIMKKELAHLEAVAKGQQLLRDLYEPLIQAEEDRR